MKKLFLLFIAATGALSAIAQSSNSGNTPAMPMKPSYTTDDLLDRWALDVNLMGGALMQNLTTANTMANYNNALSDYNNGGALKFTNGMSYGFDAQLGYFFGKSCHFGIGAGFMYLGQQGDVTMNNPFHVQYQSTDYQGNTFRQVVTSNQDIQEKLTISNMNIPVMLKYKKRFSKHWGFTADAGALFNLQIKNSYTTNASFDYEAIYNYSLNGDGSVNHTNYDGSLTPAASDVLYTKAAYGNTPSSNAFPTAQSWFNFLHNTGYNVGLGVMPNNNSGSVSYMTGSVGFMVRPAFNYYLSDNVALTFGLYYMYQPFSNSSGTNNSYQLTNKAGDYSSVLNSVSTAVSQSFGLNLGIRVLFGKKHTPPPVITSQDITNPSLCGLCDGTITLHGLVPGQMVTVNYTKDGVPQPAYSGMVAGNGNVTLTGLCAGAYTGITATVGEKMANGISENLVNPPMRVSYDNSVNPSASGTCDGSISLHGLRAGTQVTVNYQLNGTPQSAYNGTVAQDGSVTISGLCAGNYSGIVATINSCTANANDIALSSPPPPPPPPAPPVDDVARVATPIRFEVNKTVIHESSYPILELAVKKLKEDKNSIITVDGYTDITGKPAYNKVLSLKRANAVKNHLVKMGISPKRIKIVGHGASSPAASNDTPEGRSENRRAVMHLKVGE